MTIFPAIDLRGGKVVRLAQGDPKRQTVYGDDPVETARRWQAEGAEWVHVVNLDGAFGEVTGANEAALKGILKTGLRVQLGGGLRSMAGLDAAFTAGVARVVLGTAAIEDPALVDAALLTFGPERVAVGIDVRAGKVRVRGWAEGSKLDPITLGHDMRARGIRWCIFTDTDRDGISAGVNLVDTLALARNTGLQVIASGGVASLADVEAAALAGLPGVIIGRALYEGAFTLADALAAGRGLKKGSA